MIEDQIPSWLRTERLVAQALPALRARGEDTHTETLAVRLAIPFGAVRAAVRHLEVEGIVRYREDLRGWELVR